MTRMELHSTTNRVADRVRSALAADDRSGRWLARQLGETHAWVQRRLSGQVELSAVDLERIGAILSVPVSTFFGESPAPAVTGRGDAA